MIKLMLFPFSLEGAARIWLEKEPPRSILTWDDLVSKFINQFFPHSKTTNLRNEITRFQQRFDESFSKACDRFNDLLRACPHHGFSELHQLDKFYNALNVNDQDSLNSAAVVAKVNSNSSTPAISSDVAELKDMVRALLLNKKNQSSAQATSPTPAPIKVVESNCVTYGGTHSYQNCPATSGNVYQDNINEYVSQATAANYNQGNISFRPQMVANQIRPPGFPPIQNNKNNFNRGNNFTQNRGGTLPGNTVTNPKEDLKGITTRSGVAYNRPTIHTLSKVVKQGTKVTKDQVQTLSSQSTAHVQPPITQSETSVSEPIAAPVSASMPNLKPLIPYPSRCDNERRREQANEQIEKFYEIFKDMSFEISFTDALILMPKFASTLKALIGNKEKLSEMARILMNKHCSAVILNKLPKKLGDPGKFLIPCEFPGMDECLALADLGASINLMPLSMWKELALPEVIPTCMTLELADRSIFKPIDFKPEPRVTLILGSLTPSDDPIFSTTSLTLTLFGDSDFLLFEEANTFLGLEDGPDSSKLDPSYCDPEGDIQMLEAILNSDPAPSLPNHEQFVPSFTNELKACEAKTIKSSVDEPPEVELKDLPPHLEYAFLEGDNKLPVIIPKCDTRENFQILVPTLPFDFSSRTGLFDF
nr:reverse transcriptase domain-containing protein [Tanacetum cinerariifolium]